MASSSRTHSSSPYSNRKSTSSSYCSSPSPSSFTNGKMIPRSCSTSASSHYGNSGGCGSRSMVPGRGGSDSMQYGGGGYGGDCSPVGFISDDLIAEPVDELRNGDSISVTIRFRPLSEREFLKGDEIAWYADGDKIVRNEYNPATAYGFDRVFGPDTISPEVYEVAAKPVVKSAMEGVNGTVFAYGVTSSGKTHTMHGDQNSPGIIPLAIKDVFSIIQDSPGREFLLRVSYLEIYNEVINDLLDPTGQNLRVREDAQGTYVEGIKEEVVLSPGHALSFIAAGEEHRHVGSNNFNLFSSRSHTIFTLMIESSARGDEYDGVIFSQLNLIDLAGSESSKTETTGLRRKEGAYINKSLLTLGTVIGKLSEGKASHVPYRDSKLTRLLQSSLSGHGHVSLICTVTPASSNMEETHNTLKFASRAKRVEIYASRNKIIDEKSLIKKYQREISTLKQELDQLKRGMLAGVNHEEIMNLRQQLEEGQVKMQSRLEEEEEAKVALMSRIQRLTKLILVSSKNSIPGCLSDVPSHQRNKSSFDDKAEVSQGLHSESENHNDPSSIVHSDVSSQLNGEPLPADSAVIGSTNDEMTLSDQMDLLGEQVKMLAGEIAFKTSTLKRLVEQSVDDPDGSKVQIQNLEQEIQEKKMQMMALEKRISEGGESSISSASMAEIQQTVTRLMTQCSEKDFELEIKTADNRVLQEQLQNKCAENRELQDKVELLEHQLASVTSNKLTCSPENCCQEKYIEEFKKKIQSQEIENEKLKLESVHFSEEISGLHVQNQTNSSLLFIVIMEVDDLDDEEFAFSRNYFLAKELGGSKKKSSGKLADIDVVDEQELRAAAANTEPKHEREIAALISSYKSSYAKWVFELRCGFGLLMYGFGSKKSLIEDFASTALMDYSVIVVNGYLQSVNIKQVIIAIAEELSDQLKSRPKNASGSNVHQTFSSRSMDDLFVFLNGSNEEDKDCFVCVVIHNIDGPGLRDSETQEYLARVAACSHVRIIASVDHVNAPLLWDKKMVHTQFNWLWYHVPTFAPYKIEGMFFPLILAHGGTAQSAKTATIVLQSLTPNAQSVFKVLIEHQLSHPDEEGMPIDKLYAICRERFLVSSQITLNSHLTEFKDHELVKTRRHSDGQDCLYIPLPSEALEKLLTELS